MNMEKGEPPSSEMEIEWQKMLRNETRLARDLEQRKVVRNLQKTPLVACNKGSEDSDHSDFPFSSRNDNLSTVVSIPILLDLQKNDW